MSNLTTKTAATVSRHKASAVALRFGAGPKSSDTD